MLKLGVVPGFQYVLEFADDKHDKDHLFNIKNVNVIIDPKSMIYLDNLVLEYENTLLQKGFKFNNPNAKSECGCKTSISF